MHLHPFLVQIFSERALAQLMDGWMQSHQVGG